MSESTISANTANRHGGGLWTSAVGSVLVTSSTISGNSAVDGGGIQAFGSISLSHTIVADNTRGVAAEANDVTGSVAVAFSLLGVDTGATITDDGGNLIGTAAAPIDPLLGPLADNGGPTLPDGSKMLTHALLPGSPAINRGDLTAVAGVGGVPEFDQRGTPFGRVFNGRIDIGAFEYQAASDLNLVVDTLADESDGNYALGDLSLREALLLANTYTGTDTIRFAPALTAAGPAAITLTMGELAITDNTIIIGLGADLLTIDASGNDPTPDENNGDGSRVFNIDAGDDPSQIDVSISGLTITGGDPSGQGGAILNFEKLTLAQSTISGNAASFGGGILNGSRMIGYNYQNGNYYPVYKNGQLLISNCTISGNTAVFGGGGLAGGELTVVGSTIRENTGGGVSGSGTITSSSIVNNEGIGATFNGAISLSAIENNTGNGVYAGVTLTVDDCTIVGNGGSGIFGGFNVSVIDSTISGNAGRGINNSSFGNLTVTGTTISNNSGGGIRNLYGALTLIGSTISSNTSSGYGGGIESRYADLSISGSTISNNSSMSGGGGIFSLGGFFSSRAVLTVTNCTISENVSAGAGGGVWSNRSDMTVADSVISGNSAGDFGGGGIFSGNGRLEVVRSTISNNSAYGDGTTHGGGILSFESVAVTITDSVISGNSAASTGSDSDTGGGIYASSSFPSLTITNSTISGNSADFGGGIRCGGLTMSGSTVSDNTAESYGGGIWASLVTLTNSLITDNSAENGGGGIFTSTATVVDSTIHGNTSGTNGGGILSTYELTVTGSTISGNSAVVGGGIRHSGGTATVVSSTISGNSSSANSGGLYLLNTSSAIQHSTITANTASGFGGGVSVIGGNLAFDHTLVARNVASLSDDLFSSIGADIFASYSLIGDNDNSGLTEAPVGSPDANGNLIGGSLNGIIDPLLGPLAENGGPTRTHMLLPGSPALNAGDPSVMAGGSVPATDQRGAPFVRVFGAAIDIGAYERQSVPGLNLVVDTLSDEVDGDYGPGQLSLREAVSLANGSVDAPETITFAAALTAGGPATIVLTNGELAIRDSVTVDGPGASLLTIDAAGNDATPDANNGDGSRIFNVDDGTAQLIDVSLHGLTLTGADGNSFGGAIFTQENLVIADNVVSGNHATHSGGGINNIGINNTVTVLRSNIVDNSAAGGGGISNRGGLVVTDSTISGNSAGSFGGGGIYSASYTGTLTMTGSTISGNSATGSGGGIYARGMATIDHSTISGNTTTSRGGRGGGGIHSLSGSLTVRDSSIINNAATNAEGGGIRKRNGGSLVVERTTISGNTSFILGGGVSAVDGVYVRISECIVSGNSVTSTSTSSRGGGLLIFNGTLVVNDTTVSDNSAGFSGGGIYNFSSVLTVSNSTVNGNSATNGGGIWSDTNLTGTQLTLIVGSTISDNTASGFGGGIFNINGLTVVHFSTITGNSAPANNGGGVATWGDNNSRTRVLSSIVAGNTSSDVDFVGPPVNSFVSLGYNIVGNGNAVPNFNQAGDQTGILDPMLGPLANNGGPTMTHEPLSGSSAIDAGDPAAMAGRGIVPEFDQRGVPFGRVYGQIDIGAIEVQPTPQLAGDANGDATVDAADYVMLRKFGASQAEYDAWQTHFGETLVPQPDGSPLPNDGDTLLLLRFDGTAMGAAGEFPAVVGGHTYVTGQVAQAAHFGSPGGALYSTTSNINALSGTVEFWIRPDWNGNENRNHTFFKAGNNFNNGMVLSIDAANNLRFTQWGDNPDTPATEVNVERGIGPSGAHWVADEWHHVAAAWDGSTREYALYIDGSLIEQRNDGVRIASFSGTSLAVGVETSGATPAEAAFDEFRISNRVRSAAEILASYEAGRGPVPIVPPPSMAQFGVSIESKPSTPQALDAAMEEKATPANKSEHNNEIRAGLRLLSTDLQKPRLAHRKFTRQALGETGTANLRRLELAHYSTVNQEPLEQNGNNVVRKGSSVFEDEFNSAAFASNEPGCDRANLDALWSDILQGVHAFDQS